MNDWLEAEQRVERAQQLTESECWAEALAELDIALSINPNNALWHAQRGFLLEELDRTADAVEAYQRSLELEPGDQDVALGLGAALTRLGRYARALAVLEELARQFPDFEPAYCQRIQVYAELGRHEQAEEMFYLAQELDEDCPHCFYHMGASLAAREQLERAIYCWERVLEIDPTYIGVNRRIAQAYRAKGDPDVAREYFLREVRDDPGNTDLLYELAELILESGQIATAAAKFEQIIELDPHHMPSHYALGGICLRMGNPTRAVACFEAVKAIAGDDVADLPDYDEQYGEALLHAGRFTEARNRLERAAQQYPDNSQITMLLGDALAALDRSPDAADCYRRVLAVDASNADANHKLALHLLGAGRHASALDHDLRALNSRADFGEAMCSAAIALVRLGEWRKARTMIRRAERHNPGDTALQLLKNRLWIYRIRHYLRGLARPFRALATRCGLRP